MMLSYSYISFFVQERPAFIPEAVLTKRVAMATDGESLIGDDGTMEVSRRRKTERELEVEMDDEYILDLQSWLQLVYLMIHAKFF